MPATPLSETSSAASGQRWNPFRFSLRSLFIVLSLAAVASWALFSQQLDRDEVLLLFGWLGGLIAGVGLGRWRKRSGIVEGALGGSFGCLVAEIVLELTYPRSWLEAAQAVALRIPTGLVLGGVAAAALWYLIDAPLSGRALRWSRINRCTILAVAGMALFIMALLKASEWSPRIELLDPETREAVSHPDSKYIRAISSQGNLIAVETRNDWYGPHHEALNIYRVEQRRLLPIKIAALGAGDGPVDFSPDETWIALYDRPTTRIVVADVVGNSSHSALVYDGDDRGCE